jgi:hypothetical protein
MWNHEKPISIHEYYLSLPVGPLFSIPFFQNHQRNIGTFLKADIGLHNYENLLFGCGRRLPSQSFRAAIGQNTRVPDIGGYQILQLALHRHMVQIGRIFCVLSVMRGYQNPIIIAYHVMRKVVLIYKYRGLHIYIQNIAEIHL